MGDMADMLNDAMMLDDDIIDEIDPFLLEGGEDFNDYAFGAWKKEKYQMYEMTRLKHELHSPHKDDLDIALEQSKRVYIVEANPIDESIKNIAKKFGKPFKNVEEVRAKLNEVENHVRELTQARGFLKQTLDNWTGENTSCPKCGKAKAMAKRKGKFGEFWGCTGFPDCNGSRQI
jgi:ribosomal protein S27AE